MAVRVGQRYRVTLPADNYDGWVRLTRVITAIDGEHAYYTMSDGTQMNRLVRSIEMAIGCGIWVLDYPAHLALPVGV